MSDKDSAIECMRNNALKKPHFAMTSDLVFKSMMSSKPCVITTLNALPYFRHDPVKDVELNPMSKELIGEIGSRTAILDVIAKTDKGDIIDIEMQMLVEPNLIMRARYYLSQMQVCSTPKGAGYEPEGWGVRKYMSIFFIGGDFFGDGTWYNEISACRQGSAAGVSRTEFVDDGTVILFCNLAMPYNEHKDKNDSDWHAFAMAIHDLQCSVPEDMCYPDFRKAMRTLQEDPNYMRSWQMDVERDFAKRQIRHSLKKYPSKTIEEMADDICVDEEEIRIILQMIADEDKAEAEAKIAD